MESLDVNILIGKGVLDTDRDLFFGPLTDKTNFISLSDQSTMADLLVLLGLFPSKGQARKNNWGFDIPSGFSEHTVGKLRNRITILKILE